MEQYRGITIDTKPTEAMATEAERGLKWRDEYNRGGTGVGVARARDLKNRANLSLDTVKRMHSYFSRHEVDKKGQGFSPGSNGFPSAGRIAWALWGGDPGQSWARNIVERMDAADRKGKDAMPFNMPKDQKQRYYSTAQLSENLTETPEGFLICHNVPITRAGDLLYNPGETPVTPGEDVTVISRTVEDIHDPMTIASFEGKPVTINHPDEFVSPENWKELAVGVVQNVRPGEGEDADKLLADLLITDREAIYAVRSKQLREVSCGYEANYIEDAPGKGRQEGIIGNHVALVQSGRCGSECAIFDHAPKLKEAKPMSVKDKILGLFGKALDEAMPDDEDVKDESMDYGKAIDAIMKRLDSLEQSMTKGKEGESTPAPEATDEADHTPEQMVQLEARLKQLEAALAKLGGSEMAEGEAEDQAEGDMCKDSDTIARAEILAPGIVKTSDVKEKALRAAYESQDGKQVIDTLLAGKTFDSADKDLLFVGASEMLKNVRRSQLQTKVTSDNLTGLSGGVMTAERLNQINAEFFGRK